MAVITSTLVFSFVWVVCSASSGIQLMEAEIGKDVLLECRGSGSNINLVTWTRPDLGKHQYVFFSIGNTPVKSKQLPSYHDRVSLQDPHMKDGDVSVLLGNVTISDNGTYECRTLETKTGRRKRSAGPKKPQARNIIQLTVTVGGSPLPESPGGHIDLLVAAVVVVVVMVMLTVSVVVWK